MYDDEVNQDFHNWTAEYLSRRIHKDKLPLLKKKKQGASDDDEEEEHPSKKRHNALINKIADFMNKDLRAKSMAESQEILNKELNAEI